MNIEHIDQAIAIMKRAGKVNMHQWQERGASCATTEKELHACGNSACFAGWVAVSPEWKEFGGSFAYRGEPFLIKNISKNGYENLHGSVNEDVGEWLGLPECIANCLIHGDIESSPTYYKPSAMEVDDQYTTFSMFYGKDWADVNAQDVIEKLEYIKNCGGELGVLLDYLARLEQFVIPERFKECQEISAGCDRFANIRVTKEVLNPLIAEL